MNLLVHMWLAVHSRTSPAGQILGDVVKGPLDGTHDATIREGIALHRTIDAFSDAHPHHIAIRRLFSPPLRRYAGIIADIGFDLSLARAWPAYGDTSLAVFAARINAHVRREWPASAPFDASRLPRLDWLLTGYAEPAGIQRALDSVARRLRRPSPVAAALPEILVRRQAFDRYLPRLLRDLECHVTNNAVPS